MDRKLIEFEKKVIAMAKIMYPDRTNFAKTALDPIRENLKKAEKKMKIGTEEEVAKVDTYVPPVHSAPELAVPKKVVTKKPKKKSKKKSKK